MEELERVMQRHTRPGLAEAPIRGGGKACSCEAQSRKAGGESGNTPRNTVEPHYYSHLGAKHLWLLCRGGCFTEVQMY